MARLPLVLLVAFSYCLGDDGYFWHVTDFHYDFSYTGEHLSCHGKEIDENPGRYGDYWCDSPWTLVNNSVHAMATIMDDVDFVLWTGDSVLHGSDELLSYDINGEILDNVTNLMKRVFPGKQVFATFGNKDYYPKNQFPPSNNALYNASLDRWRTWINDVTQDAEFLRGGYYTVKTQYGLRIVALNTNLYYTHNKAAENVIDPGGQFAWLRQVLANAVSAKERVLLASHIPIGVRTPVGAVNMFKRFHDELIRIVSAYTDILAGMHCGHDHADGFKVFYDKQGSPKVPVFIAPSVTPWRPNAERPAHNPGIRLVKYDRRTGRVQDIIQYYLDLRKANREQSAIWELEYRATNDYSIQDVSAASLDQLITRMKFANSDAFTRYWRWYSVSTEQDLRENCNSKCHAAIICGFRYFSMDQFQSCTSSMINMATSLHATTSVVIRFICFTTLLARVW